MQLATTRISCAGFNTITHKERNPIMQWKTKEIVVVAMVGAVIGVLFTLMDYIYMPLSAALGVAFMEITFGIYMLSALVPMHLVRKPGAAVFGALVAALVNLLLGSPYGVQLILANLLEGLAVEIGFAVITRYQGTFANFALSGILGTAFVFCRDFIVFYAAAFQGFMVPLLIVRVLSAIFIGMILTKLIDAALNKTGATRGFACAEDAAK
jgi:energy-coupling factor transport system substrate-specific component